MNPVTAFDDWMIAQHQKVADRAYSRWEDVSPYWIAAQLFGPAALLIILYAGYRRSIGDDVNYVAIALSVIWVSAFYIRSVAAHSSWKRTGLPSSGTELGFMDTFFRVLFALFTCMS